MTIMIDGRVFPNKQGAVEYYVRKMRRQHPGFPRKKAWQHVNVIAEAQAKEKKTEAKEKAKEEAEAKAEAEDAAAILTGRPTPPEQPLNTDMAGVMCGLRTTTNHEMRLRVIERKLGL